MENVIDTHIHVWNREAVDYPWLEGNTTILKRSYGLEELEPQRSAAGVAGGVLVQAANSREDTAWMMKTAKKHGWISGIVGWLPLQDPAATARLLESEYRPGALLKGVRHLIHDEADPGWLLQDTVLESLGLLAAHDIPYDVVGVLPAHIATALKVAERWPGLRMIFDHLNQPPISAEDGRWEELMKEAAGHGNFYAKISGLGTAAKKGSDWTSADLEPCIEFALHHFGADRCCCGGDWPVSLLAGSYEKTWKAYRTVIAKYLNPSEQANVLYRNAEQFYRLAASGGGAG
ncbi:MAG TPA: amidohydrolase family protein [Puia sp.]|nr:amidohydrolase family protein [Puia sp.]